MKFHDYLLQSRCCSIILSILSAACGKNQGQRLCYDSVRDCCW